MEAAGEFTDVPGRGLVWIGLIGLAAAAVDLHWGGAGSAALPRWPDLWIWSGALIVGALVGCGAILHKARRRQTRLRQPLLRKLLWGFCPAVSVGLLLTLGALREGAPQTLPVVWLACYGAAVISGGQVSVAPVRWLGLAQLAVAAAALLTPDRYGVVWLAVGFGLLHLAFGAYIARRYDG